MINTISMVRKHIDEKYYPVKFYSINDMSLGHDLIRAKEILDAFQIDKLPTDINKVLELVNIVKFIDNGLFLSAWSNEEVKKIKSMKVPLNQIIGKYFNSLTEQQLVEAFNQVHYLYDNDLVEQFNKYKLQKKLTPQLFEFILNETQAFLSVTMKFENLVNYYQDVLKNIILSNPQTIEIIIGEQIQHFGNKESTKYYLPPTITYDELNQLAVNYINSNSANLNYLQTLPRLQFPWLHQKTKLMAKRRSVKISESLFDEKRTFKYDIEVHSDKNKYEEAKKRGDSRTLIELLDEKWIVNNLDYPTLWNNFIYLLEYVNRDFIIKLCSFENEMSIFERTLGIKTKRQYPKGLWFDVKNESALQKLNMYCQMLVHKNVKLEDLIAWFFRTYIKDEFKVDNYQIADFLTSNTGYEQRIKVVLPEIDRVLKEYRVLVEDKKIDQELVDMTDTIPVKNVPSLNKVKYIYAKSDNMQNVIYLLFHDQSGLLSDRHNHAADNFILLVGKNNLGKNDFYDHQIDRINYLIAQNVIKIVSDKIVFVNKHKLAIFRDLFNYESISYNHRNLAEQALIDQMIVNGDLAVESTLFSKCEQQYLNYLLNDSQFDNGPSVRNKYLHGSTQNLDENWHQYYYHLVLLVFILIIIKMNDDLCMYDKHLSS